MNALTKPAVAGSLTMTDDDLVKVLQTSLYPGAKIESIKMVVEYCRAGGLDPLQKPVHIVPMNVKDAQSGQYSWRDVIMPGVGLYRIQADRSGTLAGMSSPVFGPDAGETFTDKNGHKVEFAFPEWCEVTVRKLIGDRIVDFTAREYWLENYATDSNKSDAPNAMWRKRPRGQLAKCAEAQALRKGWPEIGQAPTAEEMEGKEIDITDQVERVDEKPQERVKTKPPYPEEDLDKNLPVWRDMADKGKTSPANVMKMIRSSYELSPAQADKITKELTL